METHNKFVQMDRGELKNVIEVIIEDKVSFDKWWEEDEELAIKKKISMTTTQGNYDPDAINWKAYLVELGTGDEVLVLVKDTSE